MRLVVTGSSEAKSSQLFAGAGAEVHGLDHNMRADFFGVKTNVTAEAQREKYPNLLLSQWACLETPFQVMFDAMGLRVPRR